MEHTKKKKVTLVLTGVGLLLLGVITWLVGKPLVQYMSNPEQFRVYVEQYGIWSRVVFIGLMLFQIVLAVIPGEPLEICAGYAFGGVEGTILCVISTTIGGAVLFWLVQKYGVKFVELFYSVEKIHSLKFIQNEKRMNVVIFLIFFIPGTPKDLLSYFVGLTPMKFSTWMLITSFARLPSIVTSTFGGDALNKKEYVLAAIVFATTLLIAAGGWYGYQLFLKRKDQKEKDL